jgi:hypothetical protein
MDDLGREFEVRALALARSIHDPLGLQGSTMILGKERDGVFIGDQNVHVFEFTTWSEKKKAVKDAHKIVEALDHLSRIPANRFKSMTGWFVTQKEPTAEQADAVRQIAGSAKMSIHCVSFLTLRKQLCDVEGYIAARDAAPFGSMAYTRQLDGPGVDPEFRSASEVLNVRQLAHQLIESNGRYVAVGEFGVGKSYAARELFREMRKRHFKRPEVHPFPIHINLRECAGLKTPAEILRRHAEEIGFIGDRGLISAWRAGTAALILDGFDEIIPARWLGTATTLPAVRWDALAPVRRLIQEAPEHTAVFVTGRGHYFNSQAELLSALGMERAGVLTLSDFDSQQASTFLESHGASPVLPEWLPTRPLFLSHLLSAGLLEDAASLANVDEATAWIELVDMICERESRIYTSVPPYTIRGVLRRLATVAKGSDDELGKLSIGDLERVFVEVSGRPTDEEVIQMLLRMPGLAVAQQGAQELRLFADQGLASTAYGEDLAEYIGSPYQGHPLCDSAPWPSAADDLAIEACSRALHTVGVTGSQVVAAADYRMSRQDYDAVLFDVVRVANEIGTSTAGSYIVENVFIERIEFGDEAAVLQNTLFRDCVISEIDAAQFDDPRLCPTFERCLIGAMHGMTQISGVLEAHFRDCDIEQFVDVSRTTNGILSLVEIPAAERVALTVLNKVYVKRGRGRKDSGLTRGLEPGMWDLVPGIVEKMASKGVLVAVQRKSATVYMPSRAHRQLVTRVLESPIGFDLDGFLHEAGAMA